jgi:predicted Ser/Thr protein kinase
MSRPAGGRGPCRTGEIIAFLYQYEFGGQPASDPAVSTATPPTSLSLTFDRAALDSGSKEVLRDGRWANARVYRFNFDGAEWVVKDFAPRSFWVRNTLGRLLLRRELRTLQRLAGIDGVPGDAFRVDSHAIAARFIPGVTLGNVAAEQLNAPFFAALERLLQQVHARGIVHLDTRGTGNMLMTPAGRPALIDFQASLGTRWMPVSWRRWLDDLDMTGVYKKWLQHDPESMGPERRALYEHMTRRRRLWVARGYAGAAKQKRSDA